MSEQEELQTGQVYSTFFKSEEMGSYLYMGTRRRFNVNREEYPNIVHVIAGYKKGDVDCLRFDDDWHTLKDGAIRLTNKRRIYVDRKELEYLVDRLERAGLRKEN